MRSLLSKAVLAVMMVGLLLSASCSATGSSTTELETSTKVTKPSGSLTVAADFGRSVLDPRDTLPKDFYTLAAGVFDSLIDLSPDAQPRPALAERWEISTDGKDHTFYIRKGVKFHDGSDLTGADVKFSIERVLAPEAAHTMAPQLRTAIASVELKDDYTVVLHRKQPLFEMDPLVETLTGLVVVVPKKYIQEKGDAYFGAHPIGSGPFKVVKWEPGNRLDLEAVDSHWRAVPKFKNITLLNVTEEATKIAMLKTGELDMGEVSPDSAVAVKAAGLRIVLHDGGAQFFIALFYDLENPTKYAIGDVKVRKALSLAIDRKEMGDKLYGGFAQPSAFFYAPRTAYFFDPNVLKPEPFDPEGAKKIIAEAGYPNGFALKVWDLGGGSILSTLDLALAGYWRKVGVNTELTPIDVAALDKIFKPKHTPAMWPTVRPYFTGGGMFGFEKVPLIYDSAVSSFKNMNIPKLNELIRQVPMTRDPAEKKRLALEAAVMAKNDFSMIPILDLITPFAVGPKVGEFAPIKNIAGLAASLETITHAK